MSIKLWLNSLSECWTWELHSESNWLSIFSELFVLELSRELCILQPTCFIVVLMLLIHLLMGMSWKFISPKSFTQKLICQYVLKLDISFSFQNELKKRKIRSYMFSLSARVLYPMNFYFLRFHRPKNIDASVF